MLRLSHTPDFFNCATKDFLFNLFYSIQTSRGRRSHVVKHDETNSVNSALKLNLTFFCFYCPTFGVKVRPRLETSVCNKSCNFEAALTPCCASSFQNNGVLKRLRLCIT